MLKRICFLFFFSRGESKKKARHNDGCAPYSYHTKHHGEKPKKKHHVEGSVVSICVQDQGPCLELSLGRPFF